MDDPSLFQALEERTVDLLFLSESEAPLTPFQWPAQAGGSSETALRHQLELPEDTPIQAKSLSDFLAPMRYEYNEQPEVEKESVRRFTELQHWLETHLSEVQAFRIGDDSEIPAYVLGRTPSGNWLGFSTQLVET